MLLDGAETSGGSLGMTDSRRASLDLEEQAELVELANDAIFVRAVADARILSWNRGAEVLYGWARNEAIGRVSHELLRTEFPRPLEEIEAELRQSGSWEGELVQRTRDCRRVAVSSRWAVKRDNDGVLVAFLEINTDITQWKQANSALRREQEFSRRLVDSSTDGIMAYDLEYCYTLWNPAMERLTGLGRDQVLGKPAFEVFPFLRELGQDRFFADALAGHTMVAPARPFTVPETGHTGVFEAQYAPVRDESGAIIGGLGFVRDVTEHKRAETERAELEHEQAARAQAEAALRERDQVLATVSHDLKAPLTTIRGQAQLLQRQAGRPGQLDLDRLLKGLKLIDSAAGKMASWIDELLDTARLEAGRPLELRREPTDLVELAWQAAAEHQRSTTRHRIKVRTVESKLVGMWDPARLSRVLDNLVTNAIKFSPDGGDVTLEVDRIQDNGKGCAVLRVRDQGIGIPEQDQAHIFERFRRGANVAAIVGTGIGLAGACLIVEQHGGTLSVASREGEGSTFTVRLPLVPD